MNKPMIVRPQKLARHIVIVDGISCSGKSLIAPLISTFKRGELWILDQLFEYLCAMDHHCKISREAACALARMYADMDLYNLMIGRYTNFRSSDFSSAAGNLLDKRYHDRLLLPDGDAVVRRIQKEKPLLLLMVHYIFHQSELLFDAFQDNLDLYILTVRHPLWLFEAWYGGRWDRRIGKDPREFHLSYKVRRKIVPYFASEWNEEYLRLRPVEQAIAVTTRFLDEFERHHDAMPATERKKVFLIPFEKFVRDPQKHLQVIAKRLESHTTALTVKRLKTLRLPRSFDTGDVLTQQNKIENLFRRERVSSKYQKLLRTACDRYERRYLNN